MEQDIKSKIGKQAENLEEMIKQYCLSQKELWQRVPYLALMADSYMDSGDSTLQKAYETGYWKISRVSSGMNVVVDCETGELCYDVPSGYDRTRRQIQSSDILGLAYSMVYLDAQQAIDRLRQRIQGRGNDDSKPRLSAWRENKMRELGLDENRLYRREDKKERLARDDNQL